MIRTPAPPFDRPGRAGPDPGSRAPAPGDRPGQPAARAAGIDRIERRLRASLGRRTPAGAQRLDLVEHAARPRHLPAGAAGASRTLPPGSPCSGWPGGCSAPGPTPDEVQQILRGLPHNVTTEMDLELWRLADADPRATRPRRRAFADGPPSELARPIARGHAARRSRRTGSTASWPVRPPGGRRDRPRHAALVRRPQPPDRRGGATICGWTTRRWPRTPCSPRRQRAAEAMVTTLTVGRRHAAGCAARPCASRCAGPGELAGLRERRSTCSCWPWPRMRASSPGSATSSCAQRPDRRADDVFLLDLSRTRRGGCAARTSTSWSTARQAAYARETAPPAHTAGAALRRHRARGGRGHRRAARRGSGRQPGLGRHHHRSRPGSSSTRSAPTWSRARSSSPRPPTRAGPRCS